MTRGFSAAKAWRVGLSEIGTGVVDGSGRACG